MNTLLANQAFINSIVGLCTQLALLIGAVVAFVKLRTTAVAQGEKLAAQAETIKTVQRQADQQAIPAASPVTVNVPAGAGALAAAGPSAPGINAVVKLPGYDQVTDLAVGGISATGQIDCGYECAAMCLRVLTGVPIPASYLRWLVKGPGDTSLATADDIVAAFAACEHLAHRRDGPYDALKVELGHSVAADKPAIVLGRWLGPIGHWMSCEAVDEARGVLFRDPYGGPQYWVAWAVVEQRYLGTYVHVDERATYAA